MTDELDSVTMAQLRRFIMAVGDVELGTKHNDGELDEREELKPHHIVEATGNAIETIEDLQAENRELRDTIDALTDIGSEKTTKEEKIASIVTYAERHASDPRRDRVAVKVREIVGATGISRRYAYDLIDELPNEYEWLLDRHEIQQYGDLELDKDGMDRALVVDFEVLHSEEGSVNKFTTTTATKAHAD